MAILASEIMDGSRALLNDTGATLYTNTALLPYLKMANKKLEKSLLMFQVGIVRIKSTSINVAALAVTVTLPSDFLLPISLSERSSGGTNDQWTPMEERDFEPNRVPVNSINYWAFRNNAINIPPCLVAREVLLEYERRLALITTSSSPEEDNTLLVAYLETKTAELAARYIGMNETVANTIRDNEFLVAEDELLRVLTLASQGVRYRRLRFSSTRIVLQ